MTVVDDFNDFYDPQIKRENLKPHQHNPNFRLSEADIRDSVALERVFQETNFDCVVHLAARAGVRPSLTQPQLYTETNINGTVNLLELARQKDIKQFIFGSSSSVYGINAKVRPRQRPDLAIHKFASLISQGKPIPVFGDGSSRRDYTFVSDIIDGVRAAIDYSASEYEVINLGESRTVTLSELIGLLEKELSKKAIVDRQPSQPGDVPQTFAAIDKARSLLKYEPKIEIESGLHRFIQWFRQRAR